MNKFLSYLHRLWDPRPYLAKHWREAADNYEERLRAHTSLKPEVIEAVLTERARIITLFTDLLPEYKGRVCLVVTPDARAEHCAVFVWKKQLYLLVSGALLGRPFDHPEDPGYKAWEWLARHEAVHIQKRHLPWLFHTRRLLRLTYLIGIVPALFLRFLAPPEIVSNWLYPYLWLLGGFWLLQTTLGLALEWQADVVASAAIKEPAVIQDAEKSLVRMRAQAIARLPMPFGWIQYIFSSLLVDPHPPLVLRLWWLRRRRRNLDEHIC